MTARTATGIERRRAGNGPVDRRDQMMAATAATAALLLEIGDPLSGMPSAVEELREAIDCDQVAIRPLRRVEGRWQRQPRLGCCNAPGVPPLVIEDHVSTSELRAIDERIGRLMTEGEVAGWPEMLTPEVRARVVAASGYHQTLAAPVSHGDRLWGVLTISSRDPDRRFTHGELEALQLTAQLFSAALRRAEANDQLSRRDEIMRAVARVATDARALGDPDETARRLVGELAASTGRPIVSVCRTVRGAKMMEVVALHGDVDPGKATLEERALFADVVEAYRAGRHVVIRGEDLSAGQRAVLAKAGTTAENLLGTPITVDGELWGHIVLADEEASRAYSETEIEAIRIAAGLVAAAATRAGAEAALRESEAMLLQSQKLEAIGLFAGGVAHDFSNTLMAVRGFAALIDEVTHEDETRSYAQHILDAAERSSVLLRRLLDLARKDRHEPVVSDVAAMLASLHTLLGGIVPRNIVLTVDADEATPLVEIDPGEFEQVVVNLVVNACDALPHGGTIAIAAGPGTDGGVEITVADTGTGIDPDAIGRIFDPFFTTKDKARGSGIGLTVVQGIVTRAGGTITTTSAIGSGSTFTVTLPSATASATVTERPAIVPLPDQAPAGRERVLLVEDDDRLRPALETLLRRRGHDVISVASGEAALDVLARERGCFSVVVTDVVMPGMDGRALAADVRRLYPDLAVVLMSGYQFDIGPALEGTSFVPKHTACSDLLDAVDLASRPRAA